MSTGKTESVTLALEETEGMAFQADFATGHHVMFDAAEKGGGQNRGVRPTHMLLASFGACTAMDVISILRKMKQPVQGYRVRVEGKRASEHPMVFTHITIVHTLVGNIDEDRLARAIELSDSTYCSVGAMLRESAQIDSHFEIEPPNSS
ncbi:MAG: OsmC family protein [Armatimonadetes bacterium]|nr:OsmC family protein [Armatimonadota bacterium]